MKRCPDGQTVQMDWVAPLAGAWIETIKFKDTMKFEGVAPLAGAWIETLSI